MNKGTTIANLYREVYGNYEGTFRKSDDGIYLTTDRYFEKYVLHTSEGIFEFWAGGYCLKEIVALNDFELEERFAALQGLIIDEVIARPDTSLKIQFSNGAFFEIGLCPAYNQYNHPERYMLLRNPSKNHIEDEA